MWVRVTNTLYEIVIDTRNWGAPLVRQFELSSGCRVIVLAQAMFCKFKRLCNYWELYGNDLIFNFYLYCMKL